MEDFDIVESLDNDSDFLESVTEDRFSHVFANVFINALFRTFLKVFSFDIWSRLLRTFRDKFDSKRERLPPLKSGFHTSNKQAREDYSSDLLNIVSIS